jgi:predicted transcriptional regulator
MTSRARHKVGLNMRADLYQDMTQLAKDRGQTATYVLDQAVEHYIRYVAPTQGAVRPEIMARARKSIEKNRKLLELLAQ